MRLQYKTDSNKISHPNNGQIALNENSTITCGRDFMRSINSGDGCLVSYCKLFFYILRLVLESDRILIWVSESHLPVGEWIPLILDWVTPLYPQFPILMYPEYYHLNEIFSSLSSLLIFFWMFPLDPNTWADGLWALIIYIMQA